MCMVDYSEPSKLFHRNEPRACKEHICDECGRTIAVGERYETVAGLDFEGWWWKAKCCAHCQWARGWLNVQCGGFVYHGVREDLEEHWLEDYLLRNIDLGRRIIGIRRKWRKRDGSLMAVPS